MRLTGSQQYCNTGAPPHLAVLLRIRASLPVEVVTTLQAAEPAAFGSARPDVIRTLAPLADLDRPVLDPAPVLRLALLNHTRPALASARRSLSDPPSASSVAAGLTQRTSFSPLPLLSSEGYLAVKLKIVTFALLKSINYLLECSDLSGNDCF